MSIDLRVSPDAQSLAGSSAAVFVDAIKAALSEPERTAPVEVAISGGFTTTAILPSVRQYADALDWSRVRFWWLDERFVPAGSPERNDEAAVAELLGVLPDVQWQSMPQADGMSLGEARTAFEDVWVSAMGNRTLDVALVGMGPDGHIASLFPDDQWVSLGEDSPAVLAVEDSPKPPPQRLTLSMPVICSAKRIILATGGSSKREAMAHVLGASSPAQWPASALLAPPIRSRVTVCIDEAAAAQ